MNVVPKPIPPGLDPATAPRDGVAEWKNGETTGGTIFLNQNLYNSAAEAKWQVGDKKLSLLEIMSGAGYGTVTAAEYQTMVLLHELSHVLKRADDSSDLKRTKTFDIGIIKDCIK